MKNIIILFFILSYSIFGYSLPEGAKEIKDNYALHIELSRKGSHRIEILQIQKHKVPVFYVTIKTAPIPDENLDAFILMIGDYLYGYPAEILNIPNEDGLFDNFVLTYEPSGAIDFYTFMKYKVQNFNKATIGFSYESQKYNSRGPDLKISQDGTKLINDMLKMLEVYKDIL